MCDNLKCLKGCPHYRDVKKHGDERYGYKHKCLLGYFPKVKEGTTYASSESLEDKLVIYKNEHLINYWKNRKRCKREYDYFLSKILGNIVAAIAIIISLFNLFYKEKGDINNDNTNLSDKQKQEVDSIISAKFISKTYSVPLQLNNQNDSPIPQGLDVNIHKVDTTDLNK